MSSVYLDHNSTTYPLPEVRRALQELLERHPLNPSAMHAFGREGFHVLEEARQGVREVFHLGKNWEILFTSSATEANNLALRGTQHQVLMVSAVEHPSVLRATPREAQVIPVDSDGCIRQDLLQAMLSKADREVLVSIMGANNETGVIQPLEAIGALVKASPHAVWHADLTQCVGKISFPSPEALGIDLFTFSSHKMGGILGAGVLAFRKGLVKTPQILGGGQEGGLRSGTQNVPAIYALGKALEVVNQTRDALQKTAKMRQVLESTMESCCDRVIIAAKGASRLPNTSCVILPGVKSDRQAMFFDLQNICVGVGSACSAGAQKSSVLTSMGLNQKESESAIRISLGWNTTEDDVARFIDCWKKMFCDFL